MKVGRVSFGIQLRAPEVWAKAQETNSDEYGQKVISYAKDWAELMEKDVEFGEYSVREVAEYTAKKADQKYHTTDSMRCCALYLLANAWKYGEALRKWNISKYGDK